MKLKAIKKLLEKRAKGFHYTEISEEYVNFGEKERAKKEAILTKTKNFENEENSISTEQNELVTDCGGVTLFSNDESDVLDSVLSKKSDYFQGIKKIEPFKRGVGRPKKEQTEKVENQENQNQSKLVLVKKKVVQHFVEPDILAAKLLIDLSDEKISDEIETISEEEIAKRKNEIEAEIKKLLSKRNQL